MNTSTRVAGTKTSVFIYQGFTNKDRPIVRKTLAGLRGRTMDRGGNSIAFTGLRGVLLLALASFALLTFCPPAHGTTLWAAAGAAVQDGGTLLGKNYDGKHVNLELRMVIPRQGLSYLGLFPLPSRKGQGPVAGVNEKGLAVVSANADTLHEGKQGHSAERLPEALLTGFETVEDALSNRTSLKD
jgi:hypothetical protein